MYMNAIAYVGLLFNAARADVLKLSIPGPVRPSDMPPHYEMQQWPVVPRHEFGVYDDGDADLFTAPISSAPLFPPSAEPHQYDMKKWPDDQKQVVSLLNNAGLFKAPTGFGDRSEISSVTHVR
jgi:hypothetical protein